jgi:hydrogenase-4 component F
VTDLVISLVVLVPGLAVATAGATALASKPGLADGANRVGAIVVAATALALSAVGLQRDHPLSGTAYLLDARGAAFLAVVAVVGLTSALLSPRYLDGAGRSLFTAARARRSYYVSFHLFWAALLALPLVANVGVAWLLIEATTAASALLVAFTGRRSALEAGWKYLVLTSMGLTVALLGLVMVYVQTASAGGGLAALRYTQLAHAAPRFDHDAALAAFLLLMAGLATKIGWAPVHNWLPDAHSEAPAPVSALLSAGLLPTVMLVAWRTADALAPAVGRETVERTFIGFGLLSLAVAVPFLWRPMGWKRLLAYSSLEHMGVLALGIGFDNRLATAGVVVHVAGHAVAKSLGFQTTVPLLRLQPSIARRPPAGVGRANSALGWAVGLSLGTLSGLPPLPLFVSELFVLLGGIEAGRTTVVVVAATLLAAGFLGLAHVLIEGLVGRPRGHRREAPVAMTELRWLVAGSALLLAAISAAALLLPGSGVIEAIARGGA